MLVNTCAVRDNAEQRVIGRMGELQRHKRPGDVLGVVGCMAQRLGPALLERVPRVDLVVGPDAYRNLPELIGLAAQRPADHRHRVPRLGALRGRARRCARRVRPRSSRYSADATTAAPSASCPTRAGPSAAGGWRTSCGRSSGSPAARHHRGHAARADGQQLPRRRSTTSPTCCAPSARSTGIRRLRFTSPYPTDFTAAGHRGHGRRRRRCASTCTCRCRAARTRCSGGCCAGTPASATSRSWRRAPAGHPRHHLLHRHHRRLPRRDRRAVRGDAQPRHRCRFRRRLHLQVLGPRGHAGGAPAGPRPRRGGVGPARAAHRGGPRATRAGRTSRAWARRTRCWWSGPARRGDLMLGRTRTNQLVLLDLPAAAAGEYHTVPAHRHHRLHLHRRGRHARTGGPVIHNLAEEHVQAAYDSLRPALPGLLRLRRLPRRCRWCTRSTGSRARYVSSLQGSVLTEVSLEKDQNRAAIDVAMMDGLRKISLAPRCGAKRARAQPDREPAAVKPRPALLFTLCLRGRSRDRPSAFREPARRARCSWRGRWRPRRPLAAAARRRGRCLGRASGELAWVAERDRCAARLPAGPRPAHRAPARAGRRPRAAGCRSSRSAPAARARSPRAGRPARRVAAGLPQPGRGTLDPARRARPAGRRHAGRCRRAGRRQGSPSLGARLRTVARPGQPRRSTARARRWSTR